MLLKITESCQMRCSHCSDSCLPNGEHMNWDVFKKSIEFIKELNPLALLISGGEPLDHPFYFEFMEHLIKETSGMMLNIVVTSNGMFLSDEKKTERALSLGVDYQITNDERYYPKRINIVNHPKLMYEHNIRHVVSVGRAKENGIEHGTRNGMKCFNVRALARQMNSLQEVVKYLVLSQRGFCTPIIDVYGNIKPGEFVLCKTLGTVWESTDGVYEKIKTMNLNECNACGDRKYLSPNIIQAFERLDNK